MKFSISGQSLGGRGGYVTQGRGAQGLFRLSRSKPKSLERERQAGIQSRL